MTASAIDVPPSASPSVARAIITARKLIAGAIAEKPAKATTPTGASARFTPKAYLEMQAPPATTLAQITNYD